MSDLMKLEIASTQYVNYRIGNGIMWLIVGIILIVLGLMMLKYVKSEKGQLFYNKNDEDGMWIFFSWAAIVLLTGIGITVLLYNTHTVIECSTSPQKISNQYYNEHYNEYINSNLY